jgi:hypothetical protein
VAGRNGREKTTRIRFRSNDGRPRSTVLFGASHRGIKRRFSGKRVLKIKKVGMEESMKVGEFAPFPQGAGAWIDKEISKVPPFVVPQEEILKEGGYHGKG